MLKKLFWWANERVDKPDADAIHDLTDDSLRAAGRVTALPGPGLTISGAYDPPGVVVSGWTVRVNPSDDQQVLVTPGVAYCKQLMPDGTLSYGQVTAESAAEITMTLAAPLQPYGLWVRFTYTLGDSANRAFWNLASSPPSETLGAVNTRQLASVVMAFDSTSTPPDADGWFKIADVDYTAGLITAADIVDRRALFGEGQASGTANPATTWDVPDFNRGTSRGTIGSRSVFGSIMRILRRLIEVSGRDQWFAAPTYNENIRSASAQLTGGNATEGPHVTISATPTTTALGDFLSGANQPDQRNGVVLIPSLLGLNESYSVDCTSGSVTLTASKRMVITAAAQVLRTAGTQPLVVTSGFDGVITGLGLREGSATGDPVLKLNSANDDILFDGCTFSAASNGQGILVEVAAAGRYTFRNCRFEGADASTTEHVRITGSANVTFDGCTFDTGLFAVNIPNAGKDCSCTLVGCDFDGLGTVFRDEAGTAGLHWVGARINATGTADTAITGMTPFAPNTLDGSSRTELRQVMQSAWVQGNSIRMGNGADPAIISTTAAAAGQLTGTKASAGGIIDAVFGNVFSNGGRYIFGNNGSSTVDTRWQAGSGVVSLLDSASTDTATTTAAHVLATHFGALSVPRGLMGVQQVPIGWGEIAYLSGDPDTTFQCLWHDKDGVTDLSGLGSGVSLAFQGSQHYHVWTIPTVPGSSGVATAGNLRNVTIQASITTDAVAPSGFVFDANGRLEYRPSVYVSLMSSTAATLVPVIENTSGTYSGFRSDNPSGGDYDFVPANPSRYIIQWVVFADPEEIVA
jgi:hypothetical protein